MWKLCARVGEWGRRLMGFGRTFCFCPPFLLFAFKGGGGVRRAGGWQAQVFNVLNSGGELHMLSEALLGLCAIEKDMGDLWVASEELVKVVGGERAVIDIGIEAAFPATRAEYVPQGYPRRFQRFNSLAVRQIGAGADQFAH